MRSQIVVGAAASLCLLLGAAACGGEDEDSEADLVEQVSQTLQSNGSYDEETADCVAQVVVDEIGVEALQDVDVNADEPPPEVQQAIAAAALRATEECELSEPG
jgi:hypothetical protein